MHRTIFTTPVVSHFFRFASMVFLKLAGWKVVGSLPDHARKSVLIAAPHTSNWDLPYTLMVCFVLRLNVYWIGKSSIFKPPFRGVMMALGGISVDREKSNNLVAESSAALTNAEGALQLIVPPEGTRSGTRFWKTGFYYIAAGAGVPILLAYLDYGKKVGGLGPVFQTTGDIDADMVAIKAFYKGVKGKNADQFHHD
jgi:1-acyl-sn-glycerol-3-phosphate acyltransferase